MDFGKGFDRANGVASVIFTGIGAYYTWAMSVTSSPQSTSTSVPIPVAAMTTPWWAIAFLLIGLVLAVASIARVFGFPRKKLKNIYKKKFSNEVISLDYHAFYECQFDNVTFRYRGGPWKFVKPAFSGLARLEVQSAPVKNAIDFLKYQGWLSQQFGDSWRDVPPEHFK